MAAAAPAACGTCAICWQELLPEDEAFLDVCFHHFHLHCVRRWAATQLERPLERGPPLACPLCRRPFASAIFDCQGGAFQREHFVAPASGRATPSSAAAASDANSSFQLTAQHRRRRAVYSLPLSPEDRRRAAERIGRLAPQQAQRADVAHFAQRELQALLLHEDVSLVAQHVVGTLQNAAAAATAGTAGKASAGQNGAAAGRLRQQARRPLAGAAMAPAARQAPALASAAANGAAAPAAADGQPPAPAVVTKLQAAAAPFLFEHAERFAWELAAFAAAGQATVASFDRVSLHLDAQAAAAAGAAAREQLAAAEHGSDGSRQQPGPAQQGQHGADSGSAGGHGQSSSGESLDRGRQPSAEPERSDSEGYLDLLLRQGARRPPQEEAAQQQQQQQQEEVGRQAPGGGSDGSPGLRSRRHASGSSSGADSGSSRDGERRGDRSRQRRSRRHSRSDAAHSASPSPSHRKQHRKHKRRRRRRSRSSSRSGRKQRSRSKGRDATSKGGDGRDTPSQRADELAAFRQQALAAHQRHQEGREMREQQDGAT